MNCYFCNSKNYNRGHLSGCCKCTQNHLNIVTVITSYLEEEPHFAFIFLKINGSNYRIRLNLNPSKLEIERHHIKIGTTDLENDIRYIDNLLETRICTFDGFPYTPSNIGSLIERIDKLKAF